MRISIFCYAALIIGAFQSGLAFCMLLGDVDRPALLTMVMTTAFTFHLALADHDGVSAFPVFLRRR